MQNDRRHIGKGLHIVDRRRFAEESDRNRKWRFLARPSFFPFDDFESRGIFAGDIVMRSGGNFYVDLETAAQNRFTPIACFLGFSQRIGNTLYRRFVVCIDVKVSLGCANRIGAKNYTFNDKVWEMLQEHPIFFATGFILPTIQYQVTWLFRTISGEGSFFPGRKRCPATTSKPGIANFFDDILGLRLDRFSKGAISAACLILL